MKGLKLIIAILGILFFAFVIIPKINNLPYLREVSKVIREHDINTAAFFYTDLISTDEAITKYTDK